jgi:hypothetical protein
VTCAGCGARAACSPAEADAVKAFCRSLCRGWPLQSTSATKGGSDEEAPVGTVRCSAAGRRGSDGCIGALIRALKAGYTYANVHSQDFGTGEIRGQIGDDDDDDGHNGGRGKRNGNHDGDDD